MTFRDQIKNEYPFESHWLKIDGHQCHYLDEGAGPVLLMVHGNPTWSFAWRRLVKQLSQKYRVIAVDHMGCGLSDKPQQYSYQLATHIENLKTLIQELDLQKITLFAHDWGGAIGMGAAVDLPDRFQQFVLMNTAAFRSQEIPLRIAVCRIPFLGAWGVRGLNLFSGAAVKMAVEKPERMSAEVKAGFLGPYDNWQHRVAVHQFVKDIPLKSSHPSYQTLQHVEEGLQQFTGHPMLLIWGEKDWCFTTSFLDEFERRFPAAETLRIPDAGHYVFEDAHEVMLPRIEAFLEQHV
ncbi:MAG: alpha/beta hydrolase [Gimesia sp.]|uniref:Alpha/beta hydrolase n=1 Tax=Gimesia maris TaxID=122 RepID=A0A3D3R377_9PLAN|nr:alpha/beta hydrolase [Gimesia sp.]HCO23199.1 alpha/beta hydrolase [Gimesia maris]|tara:strand:- start:42301 stop:43179 length:879 start_codon:yes stop_codon:yes gene_type:complete